MTVTLRRLRRDVKACTGAYEKLPNHDVLEQGVRAELDRMRTRLAQVGVDPHDRDQARALLALTDLFASALVHTPLERVGAGFARVVLELTDTPAAELVMPGETD